ncbi:MAG: thiamine-phosphate kinase [Buchnera aphidicola (Meitanaphis microgallis)]
MNLNEFQIIQNYFCNTLKKIDANVIQDIGDDCALITIPKNDTLAISTDTLIEGIHFYKNTHPTDLGYKIIAINLSDLAAMGSKPKWITLSLNLPQINIRWIKYFSQSLFNTLRTYDMKLIGGNVAKGPLSITVSVYGLVPKNRALLRKGAKIGDLIYVTGTLGDSAAGLFLLKNKLKNIKKDFNFLIKKHLHPIPRITHGQLLRDIANSAIDISDGLLTDLKQILKSSQCGANIHLEKLPVSKILKTNFTKKKWLNFATSSGEDYELCFTIPKKNVKILNSTINHLGIPYNCIGEINHIKDGYNVLHYGRKTRFLYKGYDHFYQKINNY